MREFAVYIPPEKVAEAKTLLETDETIKRLEIVFREAKVWGLREQGYFLYVKGPDDQVSAVEDKLRGVGEALGPEEMEKVKQKIREENENIAAGLSLFG